MHTPIKNLLVALYITGCGAAQDDQESPKTVPVAAAVPVAAQESIETRRLSSLYVTSAADLPVCDKAQSGALAYVKAEEHFVTCDGGEWATVEIKGPQGEAGAPGKDGVAGADGKVLEIPPPELKANEWLETTSGLVWTKSGAQVTWELATIACVRDGWRFPTEDELRVAMAVGTLQVQGIWADSRRVNWFSQPELMMRVELTDKGLAYCVKTN